MCGIVGLININDEYVDHRLIIRSADLLFPFPPFLMRLAGKLFGKSDAVERLVSSLIIDSSKIR